ERRRWLGALSDALSEDKSLDAGHRTQDTGHRTQDAGPFPSTSLHLQTRKDEWSDRFRIVASHSLADVVVVRAVAIPPFGVRIAAEACDREGAVDVDQPVLVHFDELLEDALVRATSDRSIFRIDVSESRCF